jgi:hypothetical protein
MEEQPSIFKKKMKNFLLILCHAIILLSLPKTLSNAVDDKIKAGVS